MRSAWRWSIPFAVWAFGTPNIAWASPEGQRAQVLFDEGRSLVKEGRFEEACPKFEESQRLDPGAGTLLNLANCYEKAGKTASAWRTYREAADVAEGANRAEWAASARASASALNASLSTLVIDVAPSADVAGLVVERDGVPVSRSEWGRAVPVDPGVHVVVARADGKKSHEQRVIADASASSLRVTVAPLEDVAPSGSSAPPEPARPHDDETEAAGIGATQRTVGYVVGAAGIVGLGVGAVFGLSAIGSKNDAASGDHCSKDLESCDRTGVDAMREARGSALASTIGFAAGGALLATGLVLVLTAPSKKDSANGVALKTLRWSGTSMTLGGTF